MSIVRRFLIAPSLSRLVRKERGAARVAEGYFAAQSGRTSYVLVDGAACHLVLQTPSPEGGSDHEERTEVPRAHAEALLDVCAGKIAYDRSRIGVGGGREALVDRFSIPGAFDLVSVEFDTQEDAQRFYAPIWFGPEVTDLEGYDRRAIALEGVPQGAEAPLTNAALDALLDVLEDRFGLSRYTPAPPRREEPAREQDALRRLASPQAQQPAPAAAPAHAPEGRQVASKRGASAAPRPGASGQAAVTAAQVAPAQASAAQAPAAQAPRAPEAPAENPGAHPMPEVDSRIDDVILGLSRALGGSSEEQAEGSVVEVEQWALRTRRN